MIDRGFTEHQILTEFSWLTIARYRTYHSELSQIQAQRSNTRGTRGSIGTYRGGKVTTTAKKAF